MGNGSPQKPRRPSPWIAIVLGAVAVGGGLQVLVTGRIGSAQGRGWYLFEGWERLYALWPFALGIFFAYAGIRALRHKEDPPDEK